MPQWTDKPCLVPASIRSSVEHMAFRDAALEATLLETTSQKTLKPSLEIQDHGICNPRIPAVNLFSCTGLSGTPVHVAVIDAAQATRRHLLRSPFPIINSSQAPPPISKCRVDHATMPWSHHNRQQAGCNTSISKKTSRRVST